MDLNRFKEVNDRLYIGQVPRLFWMVSHLCGAAPSSLGRISGHASFPEDGDTLDRLRATADERMYRNKDSGKA